MISDRVELVMYEDDQLKMVRVITFNGSWVEFRHKTDKQEETKERAENAKAKR